MDCITLVYRFQVRHHRHGLLWFMNELTCGSGTGIMLSQYPIDRPTHVVSVRRIRMLEGRGCSRDRGSFAVVKFVARPVNGDF